MVKKVWFILLAIILLPTVSAAKYEKGDYKIFALGDSEELTEEKYNYLVETGELRKGMFDTCTFFETVIADEKFNVFTYFYNGQLYEISFSSKNKVNASYYDTTLKNLMMGKVKPIFTELYGSPTFDFGYPNFLGLKEGYIHFICHWEIGKKKISLGISPYEYKYSGEIIIVDTELEKRKEEEEAAKEAAARQKSTADF